MIKPEQSRIESTITLFMAKYLAQKSYANKWVMIMSLTFFNVHQTISLEYCEQYFSLYYVLFSFSEMNSILQDDQLLVSGTLVSLLSSYGW